MSIAATMKSKGLTSTKLAQRSGVDIRHLSAYKNGSRTMGRKAATKMAPHLEESADALMIANRASVIKRSMKRGDRRTALNVTKSLVEIAEEHAPDGALEEELDGLVDHVVKFAGGSVGISGYELGDGTDPDGDGRDARGYRIVELLTVDENDEEDEGRDAGGPLLDKSS